MQHKLKHIFLYFTATIFMLYWEKNFNILAYVSGSGSILININVSDT